MDGLDCPYCNVSTRASEKTKSIQHKHPSKRVVSGQIQREVAVAVAMVVANVRGVAVTAGIQAVKSSSCTYSVAFTREPTPRAPPSSPATSKERRQLSREPEVIQLSEIGRKQVEVSEPQHTLNDIGPALENMRIA